MDNKGNNNAKKDSSSSSRPSGSGRIVTMDSIRNAQNDERLAYYNGGSDYSGQQVLGRGKRKNEQDQGEQTGDALAAAFRRASALSGVEPSRMVSYYPESQSFTGVGHRLGDTENTESEIVPNVILDNPEDDAPTHVVVTLWENGFNIDDGPLHSYDDPECAELMENIDRGELPTNIIPIDRNPVHLSVVDKRKQSFKESLKVFGGKGHILGSPTPPMSTSPDKIPEPKPDSPESIRSSDSSNGSNQDPSFQNLNDSLLLLKKRWDQSFNEDYGPDDSFAMDDRIFTINEEPSGSGGFGNMNVAPRSTGVFGGHGHVLQSSVAQSDNARAVNGSGAITQNTHVTFDANSSNMFCIGSNTDFSDSERSTLLKIRLPDGQTMQLKVNVCSTIKQIKEYIKTCVPGLKNIDFGLKLSYPRRELGDEELVDSHEINNSVLVLRM